jgi:hypothetical protein
MACVARQQIEKLEKEKAGLEQTLAVRAKKKELQTIANGPVNWM